MAVLKVPKITTIQREAITLDSSEIVYDLNQNIFYGGDGITVGGFPIGQGVQSSIPKQIIELTTLDITNKFVTLNFTPLVPEAITVVPVGGPEQLLGVDYIITGNILSWDSLGLDGILDNTDKLIIHY
jgi:hypothetical protein